MIAVTTRSHARGLRDAVPLLLGTKLIERDLATAPACDRYVSVVSSPKQVWTLSVWRDPDEMRSYMRRHAHARIMWKQPDLLRCYWGMRWEPGPSQAGRWEGKPWSFPPPRVDGEPPPGDPPPAQWMEAALGRTVRVERRSVAGATALTYRLKLPRWKLALAVLELRRLRELARSDSDTAIASLGLGTDGSACLLVVVPSPDGARRLRESEVHRRLQDRWGDRFWWSTWEADSEFGQWEGRRLREGQLVDAAMLVDVALPVDASAPRRARRAIAPHLEGQDAESGYALVLLTTELVTNSVRHSGMSALERIGVQVRRRGDWMRVDVVDRGRRFEPRITPYDPGDATSGRGLSFLDKLATRWGISERDDRRHVWFELRVPPVEGGEDDAPRAATRAILARY